MKTKELYHKTKNELLNKPINGVIFIFIVFIFMRFIWQFAVFNNIQSDFGWLENNDGYNVIAENVLDGHGFTKLNREGKYVFKDHPPMIVFLYTIVFFFFGSNMTVIFYLNCFLLFVSVIILYNIAWLVFKNREIALISALVFCIYPMFLISTSLPGTEPLFILILLFFVNFILNKISKQKYIHSFISGVLLCLLYLTRQIGLIYFPILLLVSIFQSKTPLRKLVNPVLIIIGFFLINGIWSIYKNDQIKKTDTEVVSDGALMLLLGTVEGIKISPFAGYENNKKELEEWKNLIIELKEKNNGHLSNGIIINEFFSRISKKPVTYIIRKFEECVYFWYLGHSPEASYVNMIFQLPTVILGFLGFLYHYKKTHQLNILLLFIIPLWLGTSIFHSIGRYSFPIMPFIIIFAVYFIFSVFFNNPDTEKKLNLTT